MIDACQLPDYNIIPEEAKQILSSSKKIAIVGLSPKKNRDSNKIASYLLEHGFQILPVNPGQKEILGQPCFKTLKDIPIPVDLVDLFIGKKRVPIFVDQAIEIGVPAIWMQEGISDEESADKARRAGIKVVMNRCIMKDHITLNCK